MPSCRIIFVSATLATAGFLRASADPGTPVPPAVTWVTEQGSFRYSGQASVRVPHSQKDLTFHIGDATGETINTHRIRYRFEGVNPEWVYPRAEMLVGIRFYDREDKLVSMAPFVASGKSPGWNTTPDDSTFSRRRELIAIPPGSFSMEIFMSSAGAPTAVGIYLVSDFEVSLFSPDKSVRLLTDAESFLRSGGSSDLPPEKMWIRDGNNPSLAALLQVGGQEIGTRVFSIHDDDPGAHGEWHPLQKIPLRAQSGDQLIFQWNEMFSIGDANYYIRGYPKPPAGRYQFRVDELDTYGNPTGRETIVETIVVPPFWKDPWLWIIATCLLLPALFFAIRGLVRMKIRRQFERLEKKHAVEKERLRIARDIHDDLGARLTHISLVSGMAEKDANTEEDRDRFKEISGMARDLVFAMYETVWTVNPRNDDLESLVSFICQSTENLCKPTGIRCRIQAFPVTENREVRSEARHHIILCVKEAIHNAIKHSRATEIRLNLSYADKRLHIVVEDDGRGFDPEKHPAGHGLDNLSRRMETLGGTVEFESREKNGTRVRFSIPLS